MRTEAVYCTSDEISAWAAWSAVITSANKRFCNNIENIELSYNIGKHLFDYKTGLFIWPPCLSILTHTISFKNVIYLYELE